MADVIFDQSHGGAYRTWVEKRGRFMGRLFVKRVEDDQVIFSEDVRLESGVRLMWQLRALRAIDDDIAQRGER